MNKKKAVSFLNDWALLIVASSLFFVLVGVTVFFINSTSVTLVPMFIEDLHVIGHTWGFNNASITLSVKSIGSSSLSVASVQVNDATVAESNVTYGGSFTGAAHTLDPGDSGTIIITHTFISGIKYDFYVISAKGNKFRYVATAP